MISDISMFSFFRRFVIVACSIGLSFCVMPHGASAVTSAEFIVSFDVNAKIESDRMMTVTETIEYRFDSGEHHGIYRTIPEKYSRNGATYRLRLSVKSVLMDGQPVKYSIASRSPLKIKIGDSNVTVDGMHTYTIVYQTDRAINFFEDHDELYWNVTGNEWEVPMLSASFTVRGPDGFEAVSAKEDCFVGAYGSTEGGCEVSTQGSVITLKSPRPLIVREGMTIVVAFPKGLITPLSSYQKLLDFLWDNFIILLPFLTLFVMYKVWHEKGREPEGRGTVVPQYEPPRGLTPMEMTVLEKQSNDSRAITATIIDLARRGYLKIIFEDKKGLFGSGQSYAFEKLKDAEASQPVHERTLLNGLFEVAGTRTEMSSLKGTFYQSISTAQNSTYVLLHKKGYFGKNPNTVRAMWIGISFMVGLFGLFLCSFANAPAVWFIAIGVSVLIVGVFGWFMPSKTKEGAIALEEVEGFKWFLSVTEADRLKFHNAPELKPEQFHEYLSYAIAFGVETQWANQFKDLMVPQPDYVSGYGYVNPILFVHTMDSFKTDFAKSFTPPSSAGSGRSGFSGGGVGGGFGGGGGGSW